MTCVASVALNTTPLAANSGCRPLTAGVLIFSVAPSTQNIFVLLGLEEKQNLWAEFGGAINPGESMESAAAREFSEESLCVINLQEEAVQFQNYEAAARQALIDGKYFLRLEVVHSSTENVDNTRVLFALKVPWQPEVKSRFTSVRAQLLNQQDIEIAVLAHPAITRLAPLQVDEHWLEKERIKWWSVERLREVIKNNGRHKNARFRQSSIKSLEIFLAQLTALIPSDDHDSRARSRRPFEMSTDFN